MTPPPDAARAVTLWRDNVYPGVFDTLRATDLDTEYRALPAAAFDALLSRLARAESALRYVVSMFTPGHRGPCDKAKVDAAGCLAGLEAEIDAVVEFAKASLSSPAAPGTGGTA